MGWNWGWVGHRDLRRAVLCRAEGGRRGRWRSHASGLDAQVVDLVVPDGAVVWAKGTPTSCRRVLPPISC